MAASTTETGLGRVPVLALISHLPLVNAYVFPTGVAVFRVEGLITGAAIGATLPHDVALAPQGRLTLETAEVLHVPVPPLRLCTLICQDDLIASLATGLDAFSMVAAAVDLAILVEVDKVHQQLPTGGTLETLWVPAGAMPCPTGKHRNVTTTDLPPTLLANGPCHSDWEESDDASAQVLPLPLLTEHPQLLLLLFLQGVAVLRLTVMGW